MSRPLRWSLTTLLVLLGLGVLVIAALILPLAALQTAEAYPEYAWLAWPLLASFWVACVAALVALAAAGALVGRAAHGRFFDPPTQRPLAVAAGAFTVMAAVFWGVNAALSFGVGQNHPTVFLALLGLGLICLTAALALVAATSQLRAAIALADEVGEFV